MKLSPFLLIAAILLLAGCAKEQPKPSPVPLAVRPLPTPTEKTMVVSVHYTRIEWTKAFYRPGEVARLNVTIHTQMEAPFSATLTAQITHLEKPIATLEKEVLFTGGDQQVSFSWQPPAVSPSGYGVDLVLKTQAGETLASTSTAFDVLDRWTQAPRYGFLTDFTPGRSDATQTMANLASYHINAIQFYDWMYRHDTFLTDQDPYQDPLGRTLSRRTVDDLIAAAHQYGIAAMPYTAVYAASMAFYQAHPGWAIFGVDGKPLFFGENFLVYMDPRPDSPWTNHLLDQFDQILLQTGFDGIHLDQYGDPKVGYTAQGDSYPLDTTLAEFINLTKDRVAARRPDGAVAFNCVTNWPINTVAPSKEDISYIEVWPPYTWFTELHNLIAQAQKLGNGKAVVLAAYIDPQLEENARLMDAIIFASGGGHIELGEREDMLADAYFPRYGAMPDSLQAVMHRYYDFAIRYENVIGPAATDVSRDFAGKIAVEGYSTDPNASKDFIFPIVRKSGDRIAVSLVNLVGIANPEWKSPVTNPPTPLKDIPVRLSRVGFAVKHLWLASPDGETPALQVLPFEVEGTDVTFKLPSLNYWDLIVLDPGS